MRKLIWGKTFVKAFKRTIKKHPNLRGDIEEVLRVMMENPFDPQLATHKLKGNLAGTWTCSVGYNMRIIFDFIKNKQGEDDIFLLEIGVHDEVY